MIPWFEVISNAVLAISIYLAAQNSIHTWWTGIVGCGLFAVLFYDARLYADALLQIFFIGTSVFGWRLWASGRIAAALEVTRAPLAAVLRSLLLAILVALAYGYALRRFTDAYSPFLDSLVLSLSVVAQLLLMKRRYETWWFWILVNSMSVILFSSRGLWITAALYTAFLINALIASVMWRRLVVRQ